jgi:hypothetical protein
VGSSMLAFYKDHWGGIGGIQVTVFPLFVADA